MKQQKSLVTIGIGAILVAATVARGTGQAGRASATAARAPLFTEAQAASGKSSRDTGAPTIVVFALPAER